MASARFHASVLHQYKQRFACARSCLKLKHRCHCRRCPWWPPLRRRFALSILTTARTMDTITNPTLLSHAPRIAIQDDALAASWDTTTDIGTLKPLSFVFSPTNNIFSELCNACWSPFEECQLCHARLQKQKSCGISNWNSVTSAVTACPSSRSTCMTEVRTTKNLCTK